MKERYLNIAVAIVSIAVPLLVIFLFYVKPPDLTVGFDIRILPALNASLNFTTARLTGLRIHLYPKKRKRKS